MSIPTQQKALVIPQPHAPFALTTVDVPKPEAGEVLVRIGAVALNPIEWKIQLYNFLVTEYPAIVGSDIAGIVVQLGSGVTNLTVGDRIVVQGDFHNRQASYQEYTIAKASVISKIPSNVGFEQAATIPVGSAAAFIGLYGPGLPFTAPWVEGGRGKYAGKPVVVLGGSSSVGQYALQFAKLSGFSPIITTASTANAEYLKSLGATHVVDRNLSTAELVSEMKTITSEPVSIVVDTIGVQDTQTAGYEILAPGGVLSSTQPAQIPEEKRVDDKKIVGILANVYFEQNHALSVGFYDKLADYLASGEIKTNPVEIVPGGLGGIVKGLEKLKGGSVSAKKLVVRPAETA